MNSLFGKNISDDPSLRRGTFMANVAKDVGIPLNDEVVKRTENFFKENIKDIIGQAKENNTGIIICNLVSNQKDFHPFASSYYNNFSSNDSIKWNTLMRGCITAMRMVLHWMCFV